MPENLWGDIADAELLPSPKTLLRQQATILKEVTNTYLEGKVSVGEQRNKFEVVLYVIAPLLNDYRIALLVALYDPIQLYPATLSNLIDEVTYECRDPEEFEESLAEAIGSDGIQKAVRALISQSKEEESDISF